MRTKFTEKTRENLEDVAIAHRVWIYDASIVLEFLRSTFMPTQYFIKEGYLNSDSTPDIMKHFKYPLTREAYLPLSTVYEYYLMFRQQRPYTKEIETRFKFGVILKKLRLRQHGWLVDKRRFGREQNVLYGPLMLRVKANLDDRTKFPVKPYSSMSSEITSIQISTKDADDEEIAD